MRLALAVLLLLGSAAAADAETLTQCMEKCIQYEGGNSAANKLTCKNRCGGAAVKVPDPAGQKDCMGEFKACNKACGKEKIGQPSPCHKQCKAALRTCR